MRAALTALLLLASGSFAICSDVPDLSGVWVETQPRSGRPMHLLVTQAGSQVHIQISYTGAFLAHHSDGGGTVENGVASWTARESCIARFQWPGYDYSSPAVDTFKLSLRGDQLVYVQEIRWNVPCANNHPIGTETIQKILKRQ